MGYLIGDGVMAFNWRGILIGEVI